MKAEGCEIFAIKRLFKINSLAAPFFYLRDSNFSDNLILDEESSKHIVQVLRMQMGEKINLTDGNGNLYHAEIKDPHKKKCSVIVIERKKLPAPHKQICLAVSPVKNSSRFEWLLEKAGELGISAVVPLVCARSEKQHLRTARLTGILISAMLQSQQAWLTQLSEPVKFETFIKGIDGDQYKFIAHCADGDKYSILNRRNQPNDQPINRSTILIGPEGDFTADEIESAKKNNFRPVSLGDTRLRTETAALAAAVLLCID